MPPLVEHYTEGYVANPNPRGETPWKLFNKVRKALVEVCRKFGVTGPDDDPVQCDLYVVDEQMDDDLYQYVEVYNRNLLTAEWLSEMMTTLRRFPDWGVGIRNIRFAYVLIFADRLMVTGHPLTKCDDLESVAAAAAANLWGVNGEGDPYTSEEFHRDELLAADTCGCYACCAMFPPSEITEWIDAEEDDDEDPGQTAVCPRCGKSHVIAAKPGFTLEAVALKQLNESAFGPRS